MKTPERIWIERDDECPYFYVEEELADAAPPLVEYIRVDEYDRLRAQNDELKDMLHRVRRAIEEIEDADDYVALQAALRGEPSE